MFIGDTMKRNKLNNRGFAISTALYGLLTLTILILVLIFQVNRTGSNNWEKRLVISQKKDKNVSMSIKTPSKKLKKKTTKTALKTLKRHQSQQIQEIKKAPHSNMKCLFNILMYQVFFVYF